MKGTGFWTVIPVNATLVRDLYLGEESVGLLLGIIGHLYRKPVLNIQLDCGQGLNSGICQSLLSTGLNYLHGNLCQFHNDLLSLAMLFGLKQASNSRGAKSVAKSV